MSLTCSHASRGLMWRIFGSFNQKSYLFWFQLSIASNRSKTSYCSWFFPDTYAIFICVGLYLTFWNDLLFNWCRLNNSKVRVEVFGFNSLYFPNLFDIKLYYIWINCIYKIALMCHVCDFHLLQTIKSWFLWH